MRRVGRGGRTSEGDGNAGSLRNDNQNGNGSSDGNGNGDSSSNGNDKGTAKATARAKFGDLSTAQRTMVLFAASVEMTSELGERKEGRMGLFDATEIAGPVVTRQTPLAERMRPRTIAEYAGQGHLLGEGKPLRSAIERDDPASMIFLGAAGGG